MVRNMTRRPAVTLIEVLMAMFIMAIGIMALLVLFPLGAMSMGQALKDDRCASTAAMAENVAIIQNVRDNTTIGGTGLAYVDAYGALQGLGALGGVIPRVPPTFATSQALADRWFSLPDDITFLATGTPDTVNTGGVVDRGRRYSFAYLLHQLSGPSNLVQLYVVVYAGRPVGTLTQETTLGASGTAGTNSIVVSAAATTVKRGGWILDPNNGYFYRVTNLNSSGGTTTLELQTNLVANVSNVTEMDDVAEVFDKGTSWQP